MPGTASKRNRNWVGMGWAGGFIEFAQVSVMILSNFAIVVSHTYHLR